MEDRPRYGKQCQHAALRGLVAAVACGRSHSLAVTSDGQLFAFGGGSLSGGGGKEPELVKGLEGEVVAAVAAGKNHSLVVTAHGRLLSFGNDYYGKLGHGTRACARRNPTRVESCTYDDTTGSEPMPKVVAVAAGNDHSLVISKNYGFLFSFGRGETSCLGHRDSKDHLRPRMVDWSICRYDEGFEGKPDPYTAIAAGHNHSVAVTKSGRLFIFGRGSFAGGWSYGPDAIGGVMTGKKVVAVAAGVTHTLALVDDGTVYFSGDTEPLIIRGGMDIYDYNLPRGRRRYDVVDGGDDGDAGDDFQFIGFAGMPPGAGVMAIAAGGSRSIAVGKNGLVVGFGAEVIDPRWREEDLDGLEKHAYGIPDSYILKLDREGNGDM